MQETQSADAEENTKGTQFTDLRDSRDKMNSDDYRFVRRMQIDENGDIWQLSLPLTRSSTTDVEHVRRLTLVLDRLYPISLAREK